MSRKKIYRKSKMGIFGGITKDLAKSAEKDIAKGAEKDIAKGAEKAVSKGVDKGMNKAFLVAVASIPVVGVVLTTLLTADTVEEVMDILKEHPEIVALLGGVVLLLIMK